MQFAERVYSLSQQQDDPALTMRAFIPLAIRLYFSGNFESGQKYTMCGVQIWRSGVKSQVEEVDVPAISCFAMKPFSSGMLDTLSLAIRRWRKRSH